MNPNLIQELSDLSSEARNPDTQNIDLLSSIEILEKINHADTDVPLAEMTRDFQRDLAALDEALLAQVRLVR